MLTQGSPFQVRWQPYVVVVACTIRDPPRAQHSCNYEEFSVLEKRLSNLLEN